MASVKVDSDHKVKNKIKSKINRNKNILYWSVKIEQRLKPSTVNSRTVQVYDENGNPVKAYISYNQIDGTIDITQKFSYNASTKYTLEVGKGVASEKGHRFKEPLYVSFTVSNTSSVSDTSSASNTPNNAVLNNAVVNSQTAGNTPLQTNSQDWQDKKPEIPYTNPKQITSLNIRLPRGKYFLLIAGILALGWAIFVGIPAQPGLPFELLLYYLFYAIMLPLGIACIVLNKNTNDKPMKAIEFFAYIGFVITVIAYGSTLMNFGFSSGVLIIYLFDVIAFILMRIGARKNRGADLKNLFIEDVSVIKASGKELVGKLQNLGEE